jgi:hypothetical protein
MADLETCSWCTEEVEDRTLTEIPDGARICIECDKNRRKEWGLV